MDNEKNQGHIFVKMTNHSEDILNINEGDAFVQALFIPFYVTVDDDPGGLRKGGLGHTNK